jgi:hypothetical protein
VRVAPSGRLVVWSPSLREIRLINIDGTAVRTLASTVSSDQGTFPRFGANRQTVTLHMFSGCCALNGVVVLDTANTFRRDITNAGFLTAIATRQLPNGVVLVVGNRTNDPTGEYSLFSVDANNMVTKVAVLPGAALTYGGADISHDGSRVAYLAFVAGGQELRVFTVATGVFSGIDPNARAPRWSLQGDRVAFLVPVAGAGANDGTVAVINSNGSGRRALGTSIFSPGLAWSPDGTYIIGRSVVPTGALRMLRVSDAAEVLLRYRHLNANMDYYQPDWR